MRIPFLSKKDRPLSDIKVVFHIGMPKCASSTLQAHFADHEAHYAQHGLLYPKSHRTLDGYRNHEPLLLQKDLPETALVDDILQEAEDSRCSRILLSCERFTNDGTGRLARLTTAFSERLGADAIEVLFVVRDPISLLRSSYAQFVKAGLWSLNRTHFFAETNCSLNAYIDAFRARWGFDWYDYEAILSHSLTSTSYGAVTLCDLSQEKDILGALIRHLDLPAAPVTGQKNQRISLAQVKFLSDFQARYGQKIYAVNKRALTEQIDLSGFAYSNDDALRDGLDLTDQEILARFPDLDAPRQRLLDRIPHLPPSPTP